MKKLKFCLTFCFFSIIMISVFNVSAATVASGTCGADGDNLTWVLDESGTLTISGNGDMWDWGVLNEAPWYSNKLKINKVDIKIGVTSIGNSAFDSCNNLTSVVIPNSVTSIGNSAFDSCNNLTSIVIPNSVTSIGGYAFYDCENLTSVVILDSVTSIGERAFCDCENLTSVVIPNSVTSIGGYAFYDCENLTSVIITNSVTMIAEYAFSNCHNITIYGNQNTYAETLCSRKRYSV